MPTTVTGASSHITQYEDTIKKQSSGDNLGKEDFLKLLVAQMTQQDPTNPMKDTEFVAQLATYSGLEQQMNINKNLESLIAVNKNANISGATACIGKVVGYVDDDGKPKAGIVEFIDITDGEIELYFTDGKTHIPFSKVEQIADVPVATTPTTPPTDEDKDKDKDKTPADGGA